MEILFYVGMIVFGFYCLVTEDIEDVKKDFGVKWGTGNGNYFRICFCNGICIVYFMVGELIWLI